MGVDEDYDGEVDVFEEGGAGQGEDEIIGTVGDDEVYALAFCCHRINTNLRYPCACMLRMMRSVH